jgi:6-phosphogluconolactonase
MPSKHAQAQIEILADPQSVAERAARWIAERAAQTREFRFVLSGGSTPQALYRELASTPFRNRIDWRRVELFWGDERYVPHDDIRSNYRMVRETLLAHVPVLVEHVHPIEHEGEIDGAAHRYEETLRTVQETGGLSLRRQLFDVVLLGVGTDGHTASLFPGDSALDERLHWVVPVLSQAEPRITLTFPAIQSSRAIAFLVTGLDKSKIVKRVLCGDSGLPAARIRSEGDIVWFIDRAAGSLLDEYPTAQSGPECQD